MKTQYQVGAQRRVCVRVCVRVDKGEGAVWQKHVKRGDKCHALVLRGVPAAHPPPPPAPTQSPLSVTPFPPLQGAERELSVAYSEVASLQQQLAERDDDVGHLQQRMCSETKQWVSGAESGVWCVAVVCGPRCSD